MAIKCPVCGAKLKNGFCPYCLNVTIDRIQNASNKLAKQKIKADDRQDVVYSTVLPKDINKIKLSLFVVFLTMFGSPDFYVGKRGKGWFHAISIGVMFLFVTLMSLSQTYSWGFENSMEMLVSVFALFVAVGLVVWVRDVVNLIFKRYKVPVVLPEVKSNLKTGKRKGFK